MSVTDILAIFGGLTVVYHLLKVVWRCCCGFREFVLSEVWQVDLRSYGRWAGTVENVFNDIRTSYLKDLWKKRFF